MNSRLSCEGSLSKTAELLANLFFDLVNYSLYKRHPCYLDPIYKTMNWLNGTFHKNLN
jgi:hypothetical protein